MFTFFNEEVAAHISHVIGSFKSDPHKLLFKNIFYLIMFGRQVKFTFLIGGLAAFSANNKINLSSVTLLLYDFLFDPLEIELNI